MFLLRLLTSIVLPIVSILHCIPHGTARRQESKLTLEETPTHRSFPITSLLQHIGCRSFLKIITYETTFTNDNYHYLQSLQQSVSFLNMAKDTPVVNIKFRLTYNRSEDAERFLKFRLISQLPNFCIKILLMFGPAFWALNMLMSFGKEINFHFSTDVLILETLDSKAIILRDNTVPRNAIISTPAGLITLCLFCKDKNDHKTFPSHSIKMLSLTEAKKMIKVKTTLPHFAGWQFITSAIDVEPGYLAEVFIMYRQSSRYWYINTERFILMELSERLNLTIINCYKKVKDCPHKIPSMFHRVLENPYPIFSVELIRSEEFHETKFVVMLSNNLQTWNTMIDPLTGGFSNLAFISILLMFGIFLSYLIVLDSNTVRSSACQAVGLLIRPVLNQAVARLPSSRDAFKVVLVSWLLYCMVLIEFYKGDLLGRLVKPHMQQAPETMSELVTSGLIYFTIAVRKPNVSQPNGLANSTTITAATSENVECSKIKRSNIVVVVKKEMRNTQTPVFKAMYENFKSCDSFVFNFRESFRRLSQKGDVLVSDGVTCMAMVHSVKSLSTRRQLKMSTQSLKNSIYYAILADLFTQEVVTLLRRIRDYGIWLCHIKAARRMDTALMKKMIVEESTKMREVKDYLASDPTNLSFGNLKGMFAITMIGLGASLACFLAEKVWTTFVN
jgi:hypothetical protein